MNDQKRGGGAQAAVPPDPAEEAELDFVAPEKGSAEELLDAGAHEHDPLDSMRHSAAHVMAEAVLDLFPGTKLGIGPAIEGGFYYDFELPRPLTTDDLPKIEERMRASVEADHAFVRKELDPDAGRQFFVAKGQPYKVEILDDLRTAASMSGTPAPVVSTYEHGRFIDLCRGPHVPSTGKIGPFKLLSVAGAYWRGREDRPMLQRVYGTVWSTQEELDLYLWRRQEARKRDHRRLGVQLDLFSFHDVSPGAAFWHPKGWTLYRTLENAMRELQAERGYQEIYTPPLVHKKLWEQSGHWDLYREHMFLVEAEEQTFSLKPMNCPESTFIYRSRTRSYRDLPLRLSEYGKLHRNELSGVLSGLTRVRHFVTDDAHIYVRPDQIGSEIEALLGEVRESYSWFGLEPHFTFGTRPEKALGDPALWERAETLMRQALDGSGMRYRTKAGDGAFYAPKIDIQIEDALGREWQTATIQVDLVMLPERFDLTYVDENGEHVRPVAIHRAIYGSLERFIGVLIEHTGGSLPFWCAPVQAVVVPIADRHNDAARELEGVLRARGLRVEVDDSSNRMQNKIRIAQEQKVPYMLVLGDREVEGRTAAPRTRAGEQQPAMAWDELAERLAAEAAQRRPD
ncbi:MAG: threonyl-tRNA synthetase [Chloroflexota bacterium]|jgi:threonyl-tRNA synthetase|nr:threonyl-tRNA synthetase [Chloroflexota bacterium]